MASLLRNGLRSVTSSLFLSSRYHNLTILSPLFRFSTQSQEKEDLPFLAQYLITSFGFSKDRAIRLASDANLSPIRTADRPESVIRFFKDAGLTDIQVKATIYSHPNILGKNVQKTLEPAANEVITSGFTKEILIQLMRYNPMSLTSRNAVSRLKFWGNFVGSEETLLKVIKMPFVINMDISKRIVPRINLLREYGLSDQQIIRTIVQTGVVGTPDSIKLHLERIEKLGFTRGSKMFLLAIEALSDLNMDSVDRKVAFFKTTYGWSDEDINLALRKYPRIIKISQKKVESNMDFLIREVGLSPRSIALRPTLLAYSLERRLIPRHHVLTVLKSKGLKNKCSFQTVAKVSDEEFVEKYILPCKEELPDLEEEFAAACHGKFSRT